MSLRFNKKQLILIVFLFLISIAGAASLYWFILVPVQTELASKQSTLQSDQQVLASFQSKQTVNPSMQLDTIVSLLQKVPSKAFYEQFLLNLQMAESLSDSLITETEYTEQTDTGRNSSASQSDSAQNNQSKTSNTTALPSGVKKLTYTLTVESPNYKEIQKFLKTIESLSRITMIEEIEFKQSDQTSDTSNSSSATNTSTATDLKYKVTVSTFYYPKLANYAEYFPKIDVPSAGNKKDPFPPEDSNTSSSAQ